MAAPTDTMSEEPSGKRGIPVTRLHMPLVMVVAITAFAVSIGGTVWSLVSHADAKTVHLDEQAVVHGGGVAYKNDVRNVETRFERQMADQHRKTRKLLRELELRCRRMGNAGISCTVVVPEEE